MDKHDQISPAKIKSLENNGIINFIGHALDEFQALTKHDASNFNVILEYELLTAYVFTFNLHLQNAIWCKLFR